MEKVIVPLKNESETDLAEIAVKKVYRGEILRTKDRSALILPLGVLDWGIVFAKAGVSYRGFIRI